MVFSARSVSASLGTGRKEGDGLSAPCSLRVLSRDGVMSLHVQKDTSCTGVFYVPARVSRGMNKTSDVMRRSGNAPLSATFGAFC